MATNVATKEYPKLRNLTVREGESAKEIIERNLGELKGLNEKAIVQFRITDLPGAKTPEMYTIALTSAGAYLRPQTTAKPNLVVIVSSDTFVRIANGTYSPFQAYLDGKLRPVGDVELGRRIIGPLTPSGTSSGVGVCPIITSESWTYNGDGVGTITLSGEFFTPSGDVEIVYNLGSEFFQQIALASPPDGTFTVSQGEVPCGPIPNSPYGVIVTATDITTGKYVTKGYATPCG